uniref:Uncharacterized protein n=1 Tax=Meloidogyne incognita TaxID=6306 RepID=A0A914M9T0_MELIC
MSDYKQNSGGSSHIDLINQRLLGYYQDLQKKLFECVRNEKLQNKEILKELHEILRKQFKSDPNSRCLIFVATRNCASKLADHLKKVPELPIFYNKERKTKASNRIQPLGEAIETNIQGRSQLLNGFRSKKQ